MADQYAIQDPNHNPALLAHTGTAGTAETVRVTADEAGNLGVNIISGEIIASLGTVDKVGTNLGVGTISGLGKVGTNVGIGTITNLGSVTNIGVVNAGTINARGSYNLYGQDASTEAMVTIDYPHYEIHEGDHYYLRSFGTVGNGTSLDFTVIAPNTTKWSHIFWNVQSTNQTETYLYENSSLGTGGTTVTPINNNRNGTNTSGLTIKIGQVVGTVGNLLSSQSFGQSGAGGKNFGGGIKREDEIILKQAGTYTIRFTSRADGNVIAYSAYWYEHTDIN